MLVGTKPRELSGKVFKSDPDRAFGRESRSLKACYELYEVGLHHLEFTATTLTIDSMSLQTVPHLLSMLSCPNSVSNAISINGLQTWLNAVLASGLISILSTDLCLCRLASETLFMLRAAFLSGGMTSFLLEQIS